MKTLDAKIYDTKQLSVNKQFRTFMVLSSEALTIRLESAARHRITPGEDMKHFTDAY